MYSRLKKKRKEKKNQNTPVNLNTNFRREMKLAPIDMDYCLLQFDDLKFFRDPSTWGEGVST